jgi:hypothetical protein
MITSILRTETGTTFYRLRTRAICLALVILGVSMGVTLDAVDAAQGQNQVRTYSKADVERLIKDVEQSSKEFQRDFDTWLDRSSLDGQEKEDRYNKQVKDLTSALSTLRSNFDRRNDWWLARSDMQRVLNAATAVNSALSDRQVRGSLNRQWGALRRNLNRLADAFNLPPVGSSFTGNPGGYPEQGGNVRNCASGTFRGFTNTGEAELTIERNGTATIRSLNSNAVYNGRCANDVLYFDWGSFNVVRDGRNINTVEIGNERNRTSYRRVSGDQGGGGQGYDPRYPPQGDTAPNWAIGTFRGMTDNGESELTIAPNGVATMRALNSSAVHNGRYANGSLTFDWGSFNIERDGRDIRTIEVNNQQNRTSYRRVSGEGDNSPYYPPQGDTVPNWAIGTFRGMTNTGESELTISANGVATVRSLNSNAVHSGRYANDVLTFDWGSFRVVRDGRGISTVEIGNQGNRTSYRRVD